MTPQKPMIGLSVYYRTDGRNGLVYDLPAIINCTQETHPGDYPDGSKNPLPVPSSPMHVHLTVFTPGGFGTKIMPQEENQWRAPHHDREFKQGVEMAPGSGTYVELDVPFFDPTVPDRSKDNRDPNPRSWRWPVMA